MTKIELIQIINNDALMSVLDHFKIDPIEIENIDEDDYVELADQILLFPEEYTDEEKLDISDLFVDIALNEIKEECIQLEVDRLK